MNDKKNESTLKDVFSVTINGKKTGLGFSLQSMIDIEKDLDGTFLHAITGRNLKPDEHYIIRSNDGFSIIAYNSKDTAVECKDAQIVELGYKKKEGIQRDIKFTKNLSVQSPYSSFESILRKPDEILNRKNGTKQYIWYEGDVVISLFFKNEKLDEFALSNIAGIIGK